MTKRKITHRQASRIKKTQAERRRRAQKTQQDDPSLQDEALGPEQAGLLLARFGATVLVEDQNGQVFNCQLRQHLGDIVAGDHVVWRQGQHDDGVVVAIEPRSSILGRPDKQNNIKPIAANIDQMYITVAPAPELNWILLDSYLVAAEVLSLQATIVLNKIDLLKPSAEHELLDQMKIYQDLGYQVLLVSTYNKQGLKALADDLKNKTSIFVGQSGVGKSSILAEFLPQEDLVVGALTQRRQKGSHTTSTTKLYHLKQGGDLIDSPGIREFGLWHMSAQDIASGFIDFKPYLGKCKFRDCKHLHEPDCALLQAVKDGKVHPQRLQHYHKLT